MPAMSSERSVTAAPQRTWVLRTPRTTLTTWLPQDLPELRRLHADPQTMRYMRSGVEDEARTRARLAAYLREQAERGWTKWRIEDPTGRMIGRAGFSLAADGRHRELGYVLEPAHWGHGLATELATTLVRWHREHPDGTDETLQAFAFADNIASRRVLEKSGFVLAGPTQGDGPEVVRYLHC
jgi:ribosomal-protein-alanine N-acetyltransferase